MASCLHNVVQAVLWDLLFGVVLSWIACFKDYEGKVRKEFDLGCIVVPRDCDMTNE